MTNPAAIGVLVVFLATSLTPEIQSIFNAGSYGQCKTASFTGAGQNVVVQTTGADLTFSEVTTTGSSSVVPIDPATVGQVPGGFAVSNSVAYEISTTASFTGPVTLAFKVPGPISQADFNSLAILHNVNGTLVDVTASTPACDYATLTIYATTDSFSPSISRVEDRTSKCSSSRQRLTRAAARYLLSCNS